MKLIKSKYDIIDQEDGLDGVYKQIEIAGRTCYKSEDKITLDSAKSFVDRMIKSGHGAMLEHGTIYLKSLKIEDDTDVYKEKQWYSKYRNNKYSKIFRNNFKGSYGVYDVDVYVTTNLRVLVENNWLDDLKYICNPTKHHEKRVTVKWTIDRITGESFLRHREIEEDHPALEFTVTKEMEKDINSYARESTRYCNYSKEKFDNNVRFVIPSNVTFNYNLDIDYAYKDIVGNTAAEVEWMKACLDSETHYFNLLKEGWNPQFARYALGFSVLSPLIMTGFINDWKHFFDLRCAPSAHPDARALAVPLRDEFIKRGYIN